MILDLPLPVGAAVAVVSAIVAWLFRDEGWRRAVVIAMACGLASAALAASRLPPVPTAGPAPPRSAPTPAAACPKAAGFPYRLAECGRLASVEVAPMLAGITAAQGDFDLALRPGENDWPVGCVPFAVATLCHHYGFPPALPRRETAINVGGAAAAWTVGGAAYTYAGDGRMAGLQPLMVDIGALAKTDFDRAGSVTAWDDMEGALGGLGFRFRRAATLADVVASVRRCRPALVSVTLDDMRPGDRHCAVADGIGTAADGSAALHLRFLLKRSEGGGWYSDTTGSGKGLILNRATVGVEPDLAPTRSFPVIVPDAGP